MQPLTLKQSACSQNQPCAVIQMQQHGCISMRCVVTHKLQHDSIMSSQCSEYLPRSQGSATHCLDQAEPHAGNRQVLTAWGTTSEGLRTTPRHWEHVGFTVCGESDTSISTAIQHDATKRSAWEGILTTVAKGHWVFSLLGSSENRSSYKTEQSCKRRMQHTQSRFVISLISTGFGPRQRHERCKMIEPIETI